MLSLFYFILLLHFHIQFSSFYIYFLYFQSQCCSSKVAAAVSKAQEKKKNTSTRSAYKVALPHRTAHTEHHLNDLRRRRRAQRSMSLIDRSYLLHVFGELPWKIIRTCCRSFSFCWVEFKKVSTTRKNYASFLSVLSFYHVIHSKVVVLLWLIFYAAN